MAFGDTKIVINSITYDNHANNILVGVRKHPETEDSQTAEVVLANADKRFSTLNLRGLTAVISYDYGSGYTATPTLTVVHQDDITSRGNYQTVLTLVGIPDLLAEDKASKDYSHDATDTKTVKDMLTEVLDGTAVPTIITGTQDTVDSYHNMYAGGKIVVGQIRYITQQTVSSVQFKLKKVGSPTGDIAFVLRPADESWLTRKVVGDASTLTTSPVWYTATFDTPRYVDEQVNIYCEYQGGDEDNYVAIAYNSSGVVSNEWLVLRYGTGGWMPYADTDCGYRYGYTIAGIDCFTHTTSITATFDSEDSLIDTYQPAGTFKISEGDSRLDVVNRLLDYTACYKRVESDGAVHFFVKPTSGNSYTSDKGEFYTHSNRKSLVIPSKIVVKSFDDDDGYEGSATSAASYALLPITGAPIRAYVTSNAQASSLAAARIGRLEITSQVGSDLVPMNNYEQAFNYVTVTNNWNGSTTTGNIAYLNRVSMGGNFQQFFSFGRQAKRGLGGSKPRRETRLEADIQDNTTLTWGMIKGLFSIIDENTDDIYEKLNLILLILADLGADVDVIRRNTTTEWIYNAINQAIAEYYAHGEVVPRWHVTEQLIIPVR